MIDNGLLESKYRKISSHATMYRRISGLSIKAIARTYATLVHKVFHTHDYRLHISKKLFTIY